ncbi:hypothetical protein E8E12_003328 [Didymella heteroderae]|uniref:F-box domain-containing protein n=1 Tax=Didymella heteroderae TaxID=1769908 RepID=A0A9P4WKG1_9PLEO|nr:hypothetical protein E8E12_003328 [Didymella heteroderae]
MTDDRDYSTSLPPEVHRLLLAFSPEYDIKSARLINKQWSGIAATVLWSHLAIDLDRPETPRRSLDALLDSYPNGFLDNIREITITNKAQSTSKLNLAALRADSNFLKLLFNSARQLDKIREPVLQTR